MEGKDPLWANHGGYGDREVMRNPASVKKVRSHDDEPMIVLELETMKNAYACAGVRAREEVITIAGSEMRVGGGG